MSCNQNNSNRSWYLVVSKPQSEFKAQENLLRQGYETYLPLVQNTRRRNGKNIKRTEAREQALLAGFALGVNSIPGETRLAEFVKEKGRPFYNERTKKQELFEGRPHSAWRREKCG